MPTLNIAGDLVTVRGRSYPAFYWFADRARKRGRGVAYECCCGNELAYSVVYYAFTRREAKRFVRQRNAKAEG